MLRHVLSSKIAPSRGGSESHLIDDSLDSSEPTTQTASRSVQPFLHSSRQRVPILYSGSPLFALQIASSHGGSGPHVIHGSLSPPEPYGISIGSAVFTGLTTANMSERSVCRGVAVFLSNYFDHLFVNECINTL